MQYFLPLPKKVSIFQKRAALFQVFSIMQLKQHNFDSVIFCIYKTTISLDFKE